MYQIKFNGLPVYDPRGQELGLIVREPECRLVVGEAGNLSFTIDTDHPYAGELTKLNGVMELWAGALRIYKGRILKDTRDFNLSRRIETEGLLACLNDSVIPPFNFPEDFQEDAAYATAAASGNVVQFFLEWILAEHNSQVGPEQQIQLGTVSVADPNNYISRASSDYLTAMEIVKQKLTDLLGGYLVADYSGETTVLHYYAELPLTNVQKVEYGENLLDLVTETDGAETYTAILPVGKDGLTISTLADGEVSPGYFKAGNIIYSSKAEADLGGARITRKMVWDDVTEETNLQRKALATLSADGTKLVQTITVKAIDLGGGDVSRFVVGRLVELHSTPHGFSASYPLTELDPDILNPGNTRITLGATVKTATQMANKNQSNLLDRLDKQQNSITDVLHVTEEKITSAIQNSEAIILAALDSYVLTGNFEEYKQTVESQLAIMAGEISLRFTETTESIETVNGDLQRTVETLSKYFVFNSDGLTVKAGEETAMQLTLDNDKIVFSKNGEQFGWWDGVDFHTGNIIIAVSERAQFGNFAFVPRSNGSLSFLKVGG